MDKVNFIEFGDSLDSKNYTIHRICAKTVINLIKIELELKSFQTIVFTVVVNFINIYEN